MDAHSVLAIDVGGSHVKARVPSESDPLRFVSKSRLSAKQMVKQTLELTKDWSYDVVSVGVPAQVHGNRVVHEPVNLGEGWVGFDYEAAFGRPTLIVNDAAMQAVGSYNGGRMLFIGLGTGLGSTMIVDGYVEPMELGHLPYRDLTYEDYVGLRGRKRLGRKKWRKAVVEVVELFVAALEPDEVVLGGGNADDLQELPPNTRLGDNDNAFVGGFRLWDEALGFHVP